MSRRAYIHINGITYQCAETVDGDEHDATFKDLEEQIDFLVSTIGGTTVTFDVLIDDNPAKLHTTPRAVETGAAFLEKLTPPPPHPRAVAGRRTPPIGGF